MNDNDEVFEPGTRVCITGRGTDSFRHSHGTVERLTKTQIIVKVMVGSGELRRAVIDRFRRDDLSSIPYAAYGGSKVSTHCKRPKKN